MGATITTRVSDEIAKAIDFFGKLEHVDRSTITRKILAKAIEEKNLEYALEKYKRGEITIGKAASIVKKDLREMMLIAVKSGIPFQYSKEDLIKDFKAAKEEKAKR